MITSRVIGEADTSLTQPVRSALHLREGDEIVYRIDGDRVIMTKRSGREDPFAAFSDWDSDADRHAYKDL